MLSEIGMNKLSVVIPVYNVEDYIRDCVESIYRQEMDEEDFEVIIVNDGTRDRSMERIQDLIARHGNIIVINQTNQGLSAARNAGISAATGEYILMVDSDDLLVGNSLRPVLDKAVATKADIVLADYVTMYDDEISDKPIPLVSQGEFIANEVTNDSLLTVEMCPYCWRSLYRREFLTVNNIIFRRRGKCPWIAHMQPNQIS